MEHKKFKLKYEKIGVEKYLFVKSYCNRKGCSGSSTKRRILKCGKGREYSQLSLSFAWENGMNLKKTTKKQNKNTILSLNFTTTHVGITTSLKMHHTVWFRFLCLWKRGFKNANNLFNWRTWILKSYLEQVKAFNSVCILFLVGVLRCLKQTPVDESALSEQCPWKKTV